MKLFESGIGYSTFIKEKQVIVLLNEKHIFLKLKEQFNKINNDIHIYR